MNAKSEATAFDERRKSRIDRMYRELRASDPEAFRACVQAAESIVLNHDRALSTLTEAQRLKLGADIETALIDIASRVR